MLKRGRTAFNTSCVFFFCSQMLSKELSITGADEKVKARLTGTLPAGKIEEEREDEEDKKKQQRRIFTENKALSVE